MHEAQPNPVNVDFTKWLLDLGLGKLHWETHANVPLQYCKVSIIPPPTTFAPEMIDNYDQASNLVTTHNWPTLTELYSESCVITPLNKTVDNINAFVMDKLPTNYFDFNQPHG